MANRSADGSAHGEAGAREELARLCGAVREQLESRARSGLLGIPQTPSRPSGRRLAAESSPAVPILAAPSGAGAPAAPLPPAEVEPDEMRRARAGQGGLDVVRAELGDCRRCRLCEGRKNIVFGVGNPHADLVFVGEAPGGDEDQQGEPFVGKAGQLLTKMIEAMGFSRGDVYIANVIKCRPPGNRNPEPDEVAACEPFLRAQLEVLRPRMIVTLGKFAAQCLLRDDTPISRLRGGFRSYQGIQLMPTFHPAYLLRDPTKKKEAWSDLKAVVTALRRMGIEPPRPPAG